MKSPFSQEIHAQYLQLHERLFAMRTEQQQVMTTLLDSHMHITLQLKELLQSIKRIEHILHLETDDGR